MKLSFNPLLYNKTEGIASMSYEILNGAGDEVIEIGSIESE